MNAFTFPSQSAIFKQTVASIGNVGEIGGPAGPLDGSGGLPIAQVPLATQPDGSDWTSSKVVRADVAKTYIIANGGGVGLSDAYLDARDYGIEAGASVSGDDFEAACADASTLGKKLILPYATPDNPITLASNAFVYGYGDLHIGSLGGTFLQLNANLNIQAVWGPQGMLLAADAARRDYVIEVDDATATRDGVGLEENDTLHIDTDTVIETGWGYHKQCGRFALEIDGNILKLNELLFFPFTVAEATEVNVFKRRACYWDGIEIGVANQKGLIFDNLARVFATNSPATGPAPKWLSPVYADGMRFVHCHNVLVFNCPQKNMRYSPFFSTCYNFAYLDSEVEAIRHPDSNLYSEHGYYERIRARGTDNLLQMHPSVDTNFKHCGGLINGAANYGVDLRGFGSSIDNCDVGYDGEGGQNTNALIGMDPEYQAIAAECKRVINRLDAPRTMIGAGNDGVFRATDSRAYRWTATSYVPADLKMYISESCEATAGHDPSDADSFLYVVAPDRFTEVPLTKGYTPSASPLDITAVIVGANGGLTVSGSAPADGTVIYVNGIGGATQGNDRFFETANGSGSNFDILDPDTGAAIDTSGWSAYTSGGKATPQVELDMIDATTMPCLGLRETLKFRARVVVDKTAGGSPYTGSFLVRFIQSGNIPNVNISGKFWIEAKSFYGQSKARYPFTLKYRSSSKLDIGTKVAEDETGSVVATATFTRHYAGELLAEGVTSGNAVLSVSNRLIHTKVDWSVANSTDAQNLDEVWFYCEVSRKR